MKEIKTMATQYMTSDKIAGLFLKTALERVKAGNDLIAKQNLQNLGWVSMPLSQKQLNWISGQVQRELRNKGQQEMALTVEIKGQVVGTWTIRNSNQISYDLFDSFTNALN
jgi:hypothetical protein